jgi:Fe-S cluster biogenesis protein NfuA/nitrite reductase/ring-hydroxylating ferredoxin subunit
VDDREARELVARIDGLLAEAEELPGRAGELVGELAQALVELYGEGLARVVAHLDGRTQGLVGDEVVAHLLLLHDLHPIPLEVRVRSALDEVAPYLGSHGGGVELVDVLDGVVRLRLEGSCHGCPSSRTTLELAVEDAIRKAAPDVERIETEGAVTPAPTAPPLLSIEVSDAARRQFDGAWAEAGAMAELPGDAPALRAVAGADVLFVRLGRGVYAYRPDCPACGASLAGGRLNGARLSCEACGRRYDVRHAGRCVDDDEVHMEPVPLLADPTGAIRVALGTPA